MYYYAEKLNKNIIYYKIWYLLVYICTNRKRELILADMKKI